MADLNRYDRIEVYSMIEEANISIAGANENNRTEKIPQVIADFHTCVSKLTELQETGRPYEELSPKDQAEGYIAAVSVNMIISKVEDSLATDKLRHDEIIDHCGITGIYADALNHFDPIMHPGAVQKNPFLEDRAVERLRHFYTDYSHEENDTYGVENYSCFLLPDEENTVDPDDPFRTETNPDFRTFLMAPNEEKMADYRAYTDLSRPEPVEIPERSFSPESISNPRMDPPEASERQEVQPAEDTPLDPDIFRFVQSAVHFPLDILSAPETEDYISKAQGEKGVDLFNSARHDLISAIQGGDREAVSKFAGTIQHQLDLCERANGAPLDISSVSSRDIDRLESLGNRAFTGSDGKLTRLNQTDPWQAWAVLKYDISVLTTSREDWEERYHSEKPSAIGSAGRCVAGFMGLMNSLSGTGIFTAYSNAVYKGLLAYADRIEKNPDDRQNTRETEISQGFSVEAVAKYSAIEIYNLLENPDSPEITQLRQVLGDSGFEDFREEIRAYLDTNDPERWEAAQGILESASDSFPRDIEKTSDSSERPLFSVDKENDRDSPAGQEKYIQRLRDIDTKQSRHGDLSGIFSFDSNGHAFKSAGEHRLDPRDTIESFRYMTSVMEAFAHGGRMDFQLPGRDMHEGKHVGILDVFMSVNQFLHTDIGYTIIKYAYESAKDTFVDIQEGHVRDVFAHIVETIETGPEPVLTAEVTRDENPFIPDSAPADQALDVPTPKSQDETDVLIAASEDEYEDSEKREVETAPIPDSDKLDSSSEHDSEAPVPSSGADVETPQDPETADPVDMPEPSSLDFRASSDSADPQPVETEKEIPADFSQLSAEVKEAVAEYLDPSGDGTMTYEEIYETITGAAPDIDYNYIDFAMDTAEVISAKIESGEEISPETAEGIFDTMYSLILDNEPTSDGFSKEDLYDMTFGEITNDDGEPVCREDLFLPADQENGGETPSQGERVSPDETDFSALTSAPAAQDITQPAVELSPDVLTDTQTADAVLERPESEMVEYFSSTIQDSEPSAEEQTQTGAEDTASLLDLTADLPDVTDPTEIADLSVSGPDEPKSPDVELPSFTDIPSASDTIPEEEIRQNEITANEEMDIDVDLPEDLDADLFAEDALEALL